jgi:hypothetical protein
MGDWLTLQTLVAFILGVLLAATVKGAVSGLRSKAGV